MASSNIHHHNGFSSGNPTEVMIKIQYDDQNRRFKLPLSDVSVDNFSMKLRSLLKVPEAHDLKLERYSDSASSYIVLDSGEPHSYKQLYRAAKAKGKLRLKATSIPLMSEKARPVAVDDLTTALHRAMNIGPKDEPLQTAWGTPRPHGVWQVFCNECEQRLPDTHFHCSICDEGDYDLCERCVEQGKLCPGEGHWLVKRFFHNGQPVNSTTERIAPRPRTASNPSMDMPGSFQVEPKVEDTSAPSTLPAPATAPLAFSAPAVPRRTCNSCVRILPETLLVTCNDCADFDLCFSCVSENAHGHHPAHAFTAIDGDVLLEESVQNKLQSGRNLTHHALCDKCDQKIVGVRYKCLDCPDWDYCSGCYASADKEHAGHRFVSAFQPIKVTRQTAKHNGIYCDGELCRNKSRQSYITGVRYKCAICHDTDFCAACEAHPNSTHNKTHPMIKFKTPIDNVSITTIGEDFGSPAVKRMGDKLQSMPAPSIPQVNVEPQQPVIIRPDAKAYDAVFETDLIKDQSKIAPNQVFLQSWKLKNNGHRPWPVGTSVVFSGGDSMLNVDNTFPVDSAKLNAARFSTPTSELIYPGRSHAFTVLLRSPPSEAHHISYWQLKTPEGVAFGHKMWVDIFTTKTEPTIDVLTELPPYGMWSTPEFCKRLIRVRQSRGQILSNLPVPSSNHPAPQAFSELLRHAHQADSSLPPLARGIPAVTPDQSRPSVDQSRNTLSALLREKRVETNAARETQRALASGNDASAKQQPNAFSSLLRQQRTDNRTTSNSDDASAPSTSAQAIDERIRQRHLEVNNDGPAHAVPKSQRQQDVELMNKMAQMIINKIDKIPAKPAPKSQRQQDAEVFNNVASMIVNKIDSLPQRHAAQPQIAVQKDEPLAEKSSKPASTAVESVSVPEEVKEVKKEDMEGSAMVFPTLEKESPSSSTHQDGVSMHTAPSVAASDAVTTAPTVTEADTMTERNLDDLDFSDDEEGLFTDDEYEILTASDTMHE